MDERDDEVSYLIKNLKGYCLSRAVEFPPSVWDNEDIIKNIKENKKFNKELKFKSDYCICIGRKLDGEFKPSEFLKTIIEEKILFKKCTDYKKLENNKINHLGDMHYRIGTGGVSYHYHKEGGEREYWYTNSPLLKYFFKFMFNQNWNANNYVDLHEGRFSEWENNEIFVVEKEGKVGYEHTSHEEIAKFKKYANIDN